MVGSDKSGQFSPVLFPSQYPALLKIVCHKLNTPSVCFDFVYICNSNTP
jgi:hypothetical protein